MEYRKINYILIMFLLKGAIRSDFFPAYAQTLILVNLILVRLVGFLVIARCHAGVKSSY